MAYELHVGWLWFLYANQHPAFLMSHMILAFKKASVSYTYQYNIFHQDRIGSSVLVV